MSCCRLLAKRLTKTTSKTVWHLQQPKTLRSHARARNGWRCREQVRDDFLHAMQNNIQHTPPPPLPFLPFVYYASRASLTTLDSLRFFFFPSSPCRIALIRPQEKVGTMVPGLGWRVRFTSGGQHMIKYEPHGVRYTTKGRSQTSSHLMSKQPW